MTTVQMPNLALIEKKRITVRQTKIIQLAWRPLIKTGRTLNSQILYVFQWYTELVKRFFRETIFRSIGSVPLLYAGSDSLAKLAAKTA
jgi:hypothetical protein